MGTELFDKGAYLKEKKKKIVKIVSLFMRHHA